jgi:hypothetical protein
LGQSPSQGPSPILNYSNWRRGGAPPHIRRRSRSGRVKSALGKSSVEKKKEKLLKKEREAVEKRQEKLLREFNPVSIRRLL